VAQAIAARATQLELAVRVAIASSKGLARVGTRAGEIVISWHGSGGKDQVGWLAPDGVRPG